MTRVLYPGSFDPIHTGHIELIEVAARLFDEVVVAAISNPAPLSLASPTASLTPSPVATARVFPSQTPTATPTPTATALAEAGIGALVVDLARDIEADFIVKGLRAVSDFESELQQAQTNLAISGMHTVFLPSATTHSFVASRLIREVARFGGDVSSMVPPSVARRLAERFA